jgi:hypothetical protein
MRYDLFRIAKQAGDIRANLDHVFPHRPFMEHRIEADDFVDFIRGKTEDPGDFAHRVGRKVSDLFLSQLQGRNERGPLLGITFHQGPNLLTRCFR